LLSLVVRLLLVGAGRSVDDSPLVPPSTETAGQAAAAEEGHHQQEDDDADNHSDKLHDILNTIFIIQEELI